MEAIEEPAAQRMACALRAVDVPGVCEEPVRTSYYLTEGTSTDDVTPAILLLHGFDSSCLEWRRLVPALEHEGVCVCAVDMLGWGFTERPQHCSFSAEAKLLHLEGFIRKVLGKRPLLLLGTSLGAAFAVAMALRTPARGLVAMSPQVFVEGVGPMAALPEPIAELGVGLLGTEPLRGLANWLSYADPDRFATEDAMRVGRLSVLTEGWARSTLDYMSSGGIAVGARVRELQLPTLCVFGRQDGIVEPEGSAAAFKAALGQEGQLEVAWVDNCGHVPHLERPAETAELLVDWMGRQRAAA